MRYETNGNLTLEEMASDPDKREWNRTFAVILRGPIEDLARINQTIEESGIHRVFMRISPRHLYITNQLAQDHPVCQRTAKRRSMNKK